ncbi:unnamed protein product [Penicillium salamii]|uniref:Nephrocystin 3-like N-terminal domain-containing protein n=1 Tax=Penicillium salamii TaxID=1612424 RepID=A0A9W4JM60_9EURO|nr:unnamed protein product [Penicillium salamii]
MAGIRKSTIALTLARTYKPARGRKERYKNVCLGAIFFFPRGGDLRGLIESVIEDNSRLNSLSVQAQWKKLIIGPLLLLSRNPGNRLTILLIVDALDECNDANNANAIIQCLKEVTQMSGVGYHVFLTSRPEQSIRLGMNADVLVPRQNFVLYNIERSIVD